MNTICSLKVTFNHKIVGCQISKKLIVGMCTKLIFPTKMSTINTQRKKKS